MRENQSRGPLMNRMYRNPRRGVLFGVCAGIADYFGFDLTVTRVLIIVGALFAFPIVCIAYILLALLLPRRESLEGERDEIDPLQRSVRAEPHSMLSSVRYQFRELDMRLQRLEKYVTSNRFKLDSEFRQLKD
jgi:phage shock protein C